MSILSFFLVILAYLIGSVATAIVVSRLMGLPDPRTQGSGNPGATNVLRLGNKKAAVFTLLGDSIKGFFPIVLAKILDIPIEGLALVALAAFLGHLYPIFFGFRGGKGVATALGVLLGLTPLLGLIAAVTWLLIFAFTRISAISALVTAVLMPFYTWWLATALPITAAILSMVVLLIWRHRSNIRNLVVNQESRVLETKKEPVNPP
jgi:glycerol-3-phosphate acyltransferase PlsY